MSRGCKLGWAGCFPPLQGVPQGLGLGREMFTFFSCLPAADSLCWAQAFAREELVEYVSF